MVSFTYLLAAAAAVMTVSAQYLAVIQTNPTYLASEICNPQAPTYEIIDFGSSHAPSTGSECKHKGKLLASNKQGRLEGCTGQYTNGWKVCITSYGGNVHNGKGQHQRCDKENVTIYNCPDMLPCWTNKKRVLKCQGKWHND